MSVAAIRVVSVHDGLREFRRAPREQQRGLSRYDQLALRDCNVSSVRADPDAHVPVAGVLLKNVLNIVSGKAESVRHGRPLMNSHSHFPVGFGAAASAKGKRGTALTYVASELSRHPSLYVDLRAQVDSNSLSSCGGTRA